LSLSGNHYLSNRIFIWENEKSSNPNLLNLSSPNPTHRALWPNQPSPKACFHQVWKGGNMLWGGWLGQVRWAINALLVIKVNLTSSSVWQVVIRQVRLLSKLWFDDLGSASCDLTSSDLATSHNISLFCTRALPFFKLKYRQKLRVPFFALNNFCPEQKKFNNKFNKVKNCWS